ncbi:MAG: beta-glucosidase [Ruminococcaceae bacterium]|nr:beta-glucosidase [Oscillospiraceae bacterium]
MKLINKIIRKVTGAELAQDISGKVIQGEANAEIVPLLRQAGAEGCVLLKNEKDTLPFTADDNVAIFGRVQNDWFFVGNGSGGDVCVPYKTSLIDAVENEKPFAVNEELKEIYKAWSADKKNYVDPGFWAHWPRFYPEMPLKDDIVKAAAAKSNKALVVIGRSSGEDRENVLKKGSYYLTDKEIKMLDKVTSEFDRVAVILNIGSLIDFEKLTSYRDKISSIMIVWQSGMESGNAVCDALTSVSPSGKLTDTAAKRYEDYPSSKNFGNKGKNRYEEDIFVGYRYFETFAPDRVLYEFGYGLSYTEFKTDIVSAEFDGNEIKAKVKVTNKGKRAGKEVVQCYISAPQGKLGKAAKVLTAYKKTRELEPGKSTTFTLTFGKYSFASYDDSGVTGNENCYVLEKGEYTLFIGTSVRQCQEALKFTLDEDEVIEKLSEQMAVNEEDAFKRIHASELDGKLIPVKEPVPTRRTYLKNKILAAIPEGREITGDVGYKLADVKNGKVSLDDFTAQLSTTELELITRGEGMMNSPLGAKGNAGILGGVSASLRDKGIPPVTTTDGPSGIRLLSACSLMPCGTALACSWNTELVKKLFAEMGKEMVQKGSDILLAPGMNIHRSVLCGRNFEYYSEDPVVSGITASAAVKGIQSAGVSACPKHFACNNQEFNRCYTDSLVSQRALREIYLKGFEICVKTAKPKTIMTSYNKINGVWSHYNFEMCTMILRGEWKFDGLVMTDWWMRYAPSPEFPEITGNAYRVRSQVDVLMPGAKAAISKTAENDGTLLATYGKRNGITLGEMQRSAKNVLRFILNSNKM